MTPADRLKEIEELFLNDQDDGEDIRWLIDRVKKLTKTLEFISDFNMATVDHIQAYIDDILDIKNKACKALEEE